MSRPFAIAALISLLALLAVGCDRNVEAYVPGEEPEQPDLSKIFPEGAKAPRMTSADLSPTPAPPAPARGAPPLASETSGEPSENSIAGTVRVAERVSDRVPPGAVLFIIVRAGAGPPLAVKRISTPRFPFDFAIGPEDRMGEGAPFAGPLEVTALLDADGSVSSRSPGDLRGSAATSVEPGARGVEIVLDQPH
jgi:hypothetical protein